MLVTLLFGLAPAWQAGRTNPLGDLRSGGARGVVGIMPAHLRQVFVTVEIALCLTLLVSAGLLLRSFAATTTADLGFRSENLLVADISYAATSMLPQTFTSLLLRRYLPSADWIRSLWHRRCQETTGRT